MLTKRDLEFLRSRMNGELLNYLGHSMAGTKMSDEETAHLDYMRDLSDRLGAAITEAKPIARLDRHE